MTATPTITGIRLLLPGKVAAPTQEGRTEIAGSRHGIYAAFEERGRAMSLSDPDMRFRPTVRYTVRADDGALAYWTTSYWVDTTRPSILGRSRAAAVKAAATFHDWSVEHAGRRFEVERKQREDAKRDRAKRAARIEVLRKRIPELLAELKGLDGAAHAAVVAAELKGTTS